MDSYVVNRQLGHMVQHQSPEAQYQIIKELVVDHSNSNIEALDPETSILHTHVQHVALQTI